MIEYIAIKSIFPKVSLILYKIFTQQATQFYGIPNVSSLLLTIMTIKLTEKCIFLPCILASELSATNTIYANILEKSFQHFFSDNVIPTARGCIVKMVKY